MRTSRRGFTLVELVAVISILFMLAGVFHVLPGGQVEAGLRVAEGATALSEQVAQQAYVRRHGAAAPGVAALEKADLLLPATRKLERGESASGDSR